jgi:chromosome segregation ATPase
LERSLSDAQQTTTQLQDQKTKIGRLESELTRAREGLSAAEISAAEQHSELEDRKRLSALLKDRESELQTQREARQDLERRLTETLAKLGNSEDLVEEARLLDSQRIDELSSIREDATSAQAEVEEAKQEAASAKQEATSAEKEVLELRSQLKKALEDLETQAPEPPVHHDPEAERHIAWLQTEIVRANRDSERQLAELASSLRHTEQLLATSSRREQELQQKLRLLEGDVPESDDSSETSTDDTSAPPSPGRLRPPRW